VNFDLTYSFMLPMLKWMQGITHSWGWSIIGLTLLVRIAVAPLVQTSTMQMKKMSQLQPQMKALQDKYKEDPEQLQKKLMEFYGKNKMNPLGGCLPMLVQLPILWALYAAFSGPPFMDKPIVVPVKVVAASAATQQLHRDETSKSTVPYISSDGTMAKLAMFPGEMTVVQGTSTDFAVRAVQGKLDGAVKVGWKVIPKGQHDDPNKPPISDDTSFHYDFANPGEYTVEAKVPGVAAHDGFLFINSLGKIAKGFELLQPHNWDILFLILAFGGTTYLSSLVSTSTGGKKVPESEMTEAQLIQQQTMKMMPITMTAMFCFIPLPAGVFVYFVVSNMFQVGQTWWLMRQPLPEIIVLDDDGGSGGGGGGSKVKRPAGPQEPGSGRPKPDPSRKSVNASGGETSTISKSSGQPKAGATIDLSDDNGTTIDVGDARETEKRKSKKKKK
jgi:YidC/Oxa1 family membrane protein insertase